MIRPWEHSRTQIQQTVSLQKLQQVKRKQPTPTTKKVLFPHPFCFEQMCMLHTKILETVMNQRRVKIMNLSTAFTEQLWMYLNRFRTSELLSSSGNLGISFPCLPKYRQMENCFASMTFCFPVEGSTSGVSLLFLPTSLQISRQGRRQTLTHLLRNTAGFWTLCGHNQSISIWKCLVASVIWFTASWTLSSNLWFLQWMSQVTTELFT